MLSVPVSLSLRYYIYGGADLVSLDSRWNPRSSKNNGFPYIWDGSESGPSSRPRSEGVVGLRLRQRPWLPSSSLRFHCLSGPLHFSLTLSLSLSVLVLIRFFGGFYSSGTGNPILRIWWKWDHQWGIRWNVTFWGRSHRGSCFSLLTPLIESFRFFLCPSFVINNQKQNWNI